MKRKRIYWFVMLFMPLVVVFGCGELAMRIYYGARYGARPITLDDQLGWCSTPNIRFNGERKDAAGKIHVVKIRTDKNGFRLFESVFPTGKRKKILFIGDSFTNGLQVSDDRTYYGVFDRAFGIETFAYGGSGYGTLQEYLILDRYIDLINPDAIVLQYCYNDFINNSYKMELKSEIHNNGMRRPYLDKRGGIFYAVPSRFPWLRDFANRYSRFLYFLLSRLDRFFRPRMADSSEKCISEKGKVCPLFMDAVDRTEAILKMIRERVSRRIRLYAFAVDDVCPYYAAFVEGCSKNGIQFISGVPQAVREAERIGKVTRMADGWHWSEVGHQTAGQVLIKFFRKEWS